MTANAKPISSIASSAASRSKEDVMWSLDDARAASSVLYPFVHRRHERAWRSKSRASGTIALPRSLTWESVALARPLRCRHIQGPSRSCPMIKEPELYRAEAERVRRKASAAPTRIARPMAKAGCRLRAVGNGGGRRGAR
jgi:hypothetical protein